MITGASTGIGALTAIELANKNKIVIHYNSSIDEANEIAAVVQEKGGDPYLLQANLAEDAGCIKVVNFIEQVFGRLDVLVNNAGGLDELHSADKITWDLLNNIFSLNAFSVMRLSSLCVPFLHQGNNACIINITSVSMRTGAPTATVYAAAKASIDSFTRGLARELAPKIRVNAIAPGYINTPFHDDLTSIEQLKSIVDMTPLQKMGEPKHISSGVRFLIDNDFMTGETIDINGGLFMQ